MPERRLKQKGTFRLFMLGLFSGLGALAFNFLLWLGGIAAFPPESAFGAFLRVVPASIEEPMVERLGELAGQLGLVSATLIAAAVYGVFAIAFDRLGSRKIAARGLGKLEVLLIEGFVVWLFFGLALFPLDGDSAFGVGSVYSSAGSLWVYPLTLLLVQGVFAWILSLGYSLPLPTPQAAPVRAGVLDVHRREFLEKGAIGALAVVGAIAGIGGVERALQPRAAAPGGGQPIALQDAPSIFSDPRLANLAGSEVSTNADFYRVAIDVFDPSVDAQSWVLTVDGLVKSPNVYTLQDIKAFPQTDQYTTFECVSNEVNGNLISNAKWGGAKISDVLANSGGTQAGAKYVVFYSVDGYSVGISLAKAMMPDSLLAYSMNGETLPVKHGFPLRGVIPGLYGMMSAKWVKRISVVGSVYKGYWQTRGWTNNAEIYTEAFIVVPGDGPVSLSGGGGTVMVAGYAFAGDRGVSKVEVSFDNGATWENAALKPPLSKLTWALWAYEWKPAGPGEYHVIARATDDAGEVQTSTVAAPYPNGATGYAAATVMVTD